MLDPQKITNRINSKLNGIGINPQVNGEPSHTANLVSIIVNEIIMAIKTDAQVNTTVDTAGLSSIPGTAEIHKGWGKGKIS